MGYGSGVTGVQWLGLEPVELCWHSSVDTGHSSIHEAATCGSGTEASSWDEGGWVFGGCLGEPCTHRAGLVLPGALGGLPHCSTCP